MVVSSPLWHITMPLGRGGVHTINLLGLTVAHQRDAGAQGGDPPDSFRTYYPDINSMTTPVTLAGCSQPPRQLAGAWARR
ncbi:MAG: hypothetical protein LC776_12205 [Acidobacteria bacterium]|nr:hypothetical protein [Acidobacteriota bacterium]